MAFTPQQQTILRTVYKNDEMLRISLAKLTRNESVKNSRPNFHNWIRLMHEAAESRIARGLPMLSEAQRKRTFNEIMKQADFLVTLRTGYTVSKPVDEPSIHPANASDVPPLDDSQALDDERAGMQSA